MCSVPPEEHVNESVVNTALGRDLGMLVREEAMRALTGNRMREVLRSLSSGLAGVAIHNMLSQKIADAVLADLQRDNGWSKEYWILDETAEVKPVALSDFDAAPAPLQFSRNECLRKPSPDAWSLRGLLSAIVSPQARDVFSRAFGESIKFRSADMARYRTGDYLRRHSDTYENKCFGIVWFLSPGWAPSMGGELIIESPAGEAIVIQPTQGSIGVLLIRGSYFHQVARVADPNWVRYSIASHFSLDTAT